MTANGVTKKNFLEKVEEIAQSNPAYKEGHDGSDGTCDCIGLIIGAIRRAGGSWTGIHGSNYAARYEMRELLPVTDAVELNLGDLVYKARTPGQTGYALPERYQTDPDKRDYYHVGVVTAVSPLEITHCTTPGMARDTKLGKWSYRGRLKTVDYEETEAMEPMAQTAKVTAASGSTVKLRSEPSKNSKLYWEIPVGATVTTGEQRNGWTAVTYGGQSGWMMTEFLEGKAVASDSELITIQRAALQAIYDSIGSILQGG